MGEAKRRKQLDPNYGKLPSREAWKNFTRRAKADRQEKRRAEPERLSRAVKRAKTISLRCLEIALQLRRRAKLGDSAYLVKGVAAVEVQTLAEELNQIGGMDAMRAAAECLPTDRQREIDYAFNGIGGWLA